MNLKKIMPKDGPSIDEVKKYIEKYKNDFAILATEHSFRGQPGG